MSSPANTRIRNRSLGLMLPVCLMGLLLWAKLILVTDHPRSAIADDAPELVETSETDVDEQDATRDDNE